MTSWVTFAASQIGSRHVREHLPNQDAFSTSGAVLAVADGHGHRQHFRSDVGARLAVECAVAAIATGSLADCGDRIVEAWRSAVSADVAARPFAREVADPLRPYGSTLLALAVRDEEVWCLQIGDGDLVLVSPSGVVARPIPPEPGHDGVHTASLCQPDPLASLRTAVVPVAEVALAYACTDGFSVARVDTARWWQETGAQLHGLLREHGPAWVADQLAGWLEEPARIGGDDVTLGVLAPRISPPTRC